jgi:hypothetical protein
MNFWESLMMVVFHPDEPRLFLMIVLSIVVGYLANKISGVNMGFCITASIAGSFLFTAWLIQNKNY